jgi:hypothetical protein
MKGRSPFSCHGENSKIMLCCFYLGSESFGFQGVSEMLAIKNIDYVTDEKGMKKSVVIKVADFEKLQEDIEDLEDALELEKARKGATGFKRWKDFIKEAANK